MYGPWSKCSKICSRSLCCVEFPGRRRRDSCYGTNRTETKHRRHHGRRHRLDAAEHLSSRFDGGRNSQHRSHRQRRRNLHGLLRHAELHLRTQCLYHRNVSAAHGNDSAAASRQPVLSTARHAAHGRVPARSRLHHWRVRQEPPRRSHRFASYGSRLPGVLGLALPLGCDGAGELPRHQQQPDGAGHRATMQEHACPGPLRKCLAPSIP